MKSEDKKAPASEAQESAQQAQPASPASSTPVQQQQQQPPPSVAPGNDGAKPTPPRNTIRVRAKRPVNIEGRHIDKGEEIEVTESALKPYAHFFERVAAALVLALLLFFGASAQAQQYGQLSYDTWTNGTPTATTNLWSPQTNSSGAVTNIITLTKYSECVIQVTGQALSGSSGFTNQFDFWLGTDGSTTNWSTNQPITLTLAIPAGSTSVASTNLNVGSYGYLCQGAVRVATSHTGGTNYHVKVTIKPTRTGS